MACDRVRRCRDHAGSGQVPRRAPARCARGWAGRGDAGGAITRPTTWVRIPPERHLFEHRPRRRLRTTSVDSPCRRVGRATPLASPVLQHELRARVVVSVVVGVAYEADATGGAMEHRERVVARRDSGPPVFVARRARFSAARLATFKSTTGGQLAGPPSRSRPRSRGDVRMPRIVSMGRPTSSGDLAVSFPDADSAKTS